MRVAGCRMNFLNGPGPGGWSEVEGGGGLFQRERVISELVPCEWVAVIDTFRVRMD